MSKKAVLIGCNYEGTEGELKGCVNDVKRMYACLTERLGFEEDNIEVLIDADDSYPDPTGETIRRAITNLIQNAEPDDVLYIHYSGHGTRLPAETGDDDDTGYDECIVPTDMNLITDDDFRDFVDELPEGCKLTIVSDSCHSGGLIDESIEQIGESHVENQIEGEEQEDQQESEDRDIRNRDLPVEVLVEILKQKTGRDDLDVGKLRPTIFDVFGEEASPKMKKFIKGMITKLENYDNEEHDEEEEMEMCMALAFLKEKIEEDEEWARLVMEIEYENDQEIYAGQYRGIIPDGGILISGCQSHQTSADANPTGDPNEAYGALTNAMLTILEETDGEISYQDLVYRTRQILSETGYSQRPGLYCSDQYADAQFLG
ncbi:metacaspase-6-like [Rosa rugosa]|uniref:metacaspase-6-like n=1 Tax=Rosa rugosa TaxID=74645 RepID=UPI002B405D17|nr:metacaspase-6-like [Rosa rugosa]